MHILMLGLNHKTANVEVRSRVSFSTPQIPAALDKICAKPTITGAVILSTCNRTEIYVSATDCEAAYQDLLGFLTTERELLAEQLTPHLYRYERRDAVEHLFAVVSSLDSLVLGEQQIIGQVRNAFSLSLNNRSMSMMLSRLFRQALEVGKTVRNQTDISSHHVSVSTVAIDVAKETYPNLEEKTVLVIGSGETSELAARYLLELGVRSFLVSSRTYAHACKLANELDGHAHLFDDLAKLIPQADLIISATAAPHHILWAKMFTDIKDQLLIIDLAIPNDVEPACADIPGLTLVNLDDLSARAAYNAQQREKAIDDVQSIIDREVEAYGAWLDEHAVVPTIKDIRLFAEEVRQNEVKHLLRTLEADLSEKDLASIEAATNAIVKKLLHKPTVSLKMSAKFHSDFEAVEATRMLFGLSNQMPGHARMAHIDDDEDIVMEGHGGRL